MGTFVFWEKSSWEVLIKSMINPLTICTEYCECPRCDEEHISRVFCSSCRNSFSGFVESEFTWPYTEDEIYEELEKEYKSKCPKCNVELKEDKAKIMRIKSLYWIK